MSSFAITEIKKLVDCLFNPELFKVFSNSLGFTILNEGENYKCDCKWITITLNEQEISIESKFKHVKTAIEDYILIKY